jgi:diguanylate cyclase (GGDEF)-like protein/PAS domain S-box-containing protein
MLSSEKRDQSTIAVLIIEDNPGDKRHVEEALAENSMPLRLISAARLREGLERLSSERIDLILLDLSLPDSQGFQTFATLRQQASRIPVIILTGLQDEELAMQAMREGAQDYLVKGEFDDRMLSRSVRYALERKSAEEALRQSEERYALATQAANDGLWDWDLASDEIYYSPRWKAMLGHEENEICGNLEEWLGRIHPNDREEVRSKIEAHVRGHSSHFEHEFRIRHNDGDYRWMLSRGLVARDENGIAYRMAGSQADITKRKHSEEQLLHNALYDELTDLPNRALLMSRLARLIKRSKRREVHYAVLFLDFDNFKLINDSFGHLIGDKMLIAVANRLTSAIRPDDTVARLGGDEFVVLLEQMNHDQDATYVAERIHKELEKPFLLNDIEVIVTVSIGIVLGGQQYSQPDEILRDADIAMYRAKGSGRARYEMFDVVMGDRIKRQLMLENRLYAALERREFLAYYQPIVGIGDGVPRRYEALIRWQDPESGLVLPGEFIPLAEETGFIASMDHWIIREVCRQIVEWKNSLDLSALPTVSVNLSSRDFQSSKDIVELIDEALGETRLDTRCLRVEVTESAIMDNIEHAVQKLNELRSMGIKVELDDFGTGYSSLSYLHRFPIDGLKIDRSFVIKMAEDTSSLKIVQAIIRLAQDLDIEVIAEGVETTDQLDILRSLECGYVQGYLYARPMAGSRIGAILEKGSLDQKARLHP